MRDIFRVIEAQLSLAAETSSAGTARRFVTRTLSEWSCPADEDVALLLVSELVTNAILYARSESELVVRWTGGVLRIEVHDESPTAATPKHYGDDAATGRGLQLVEALASAWGSDDTEAGKSVWFELQTGAARGQAAG